MKPHDRIAALFASMPTLEWDGAPRELPPQLEHQRALAAKAPLEPMHCVRCHLDARSYHVYHGLKLFCLRCFIAELDT